MSRPFERREASETTTPLSKQSGEMNKLAQLSNLHGFKGVMTPKQQEIHDHQVNTKWQENEYKAKQEVAEKRAEQPWHPGNKMQLTREYRHPSRKDFPGALAGTPEQAKRYWDNLSTREQAKPEYQDYYWKLYHAKESSSQSAEASSQYGQGDQAKQRSSTKKERLSDEEYKEHENDMQQRKIDPYKEYRSYGYEANTRENRTKDFEKYEEQERETRILKEHENDVQQRKINPYKEYMRHLE